jgi:hypothetical protein
MFKEGNYKQNHTNAYFYMHCKIILNANKCVLNNGISWQMCYKGSVTSVKK